MAGVSWSNFIQRVLNDVTSIIKSCNTYMYADNLKISRVIDTIQDSMMLQGDIDELVEWCQRNKMNLNCQKCFFLRHGRKINLVTYQSRLGQTKMNELESWRFRSDV